MDADPRCADPDRCLCGTVVAPRDGGELRSGDRTVRLERGSCTSCGLQLIRHVGEPWRHIRG